MEKNMINSISGEDFWNKICTNQDYLYIVCPYNVGDFIISGGLSYAVQLKESKKGTVLIVKEYLRNVGIQFQNVKYIIYLKHRDMDTLRTYICSHQFYRTSNYIYGHFPLIQGTQVRLFDKNLFFLENYKRFVYDLPMPTNLQDFVVENLSKDEEEVIQSNYNLSKERTIILCPHANSICEVDESFWISLVNHLKERGFIVYTNIAGENERVIPGTEELRVEFREIFYIANQIKCVIGLRSGLMDYLAQGNAHILCISPIDSWDSDLKTMYPNSNTRTIYYLNDLLSSCFLTMDRCAKQANMNIKVSMSTNRNIEDFHLCLTMGDVEKQLLESI